MNCDICGHSFGTRIRFVKGCICSGCGSRTPPMVGVYLRDLIDDNKWHVFDTHQMVCPICGHRGSVSYVPCGGLDRLVEKSVDAIAA